MFRPKGKHSRRWSLARRAVACVMALAMAATLLSPAASPKTADADTLAVNASGITVYDGERYVSNEVKFKLSTKTLVSISYNDDSAYEMDTKTKDGTTFMCIQFDDPENGKVSTKDFEDKGLMTATFKGAGTVGSRAVDLEVKVRQVKIDSSYATKDFCEEDSDNYVAILAISDDSVDVGTPRTSTTHNANHYWCKAEKSVKIETTATWQDTGELVELPFFMLTSDIDQYQTDDDGNVDYVEGWQTNAGFENNYSVYDECKLMVDSSDGVKKRKFTANPDDLNPEGENSVKIAGVYATTEDGNSTTTFYGGTCRTEFDFFCQFDSRLMPDPEKEASVEQTQPGDTYNYNVRWEMGTFYEDTLSTYTSLVLYDELPEDVAFVDAEFYVAGGLVQDGVGTDETYGKLAYDESEHVVSFTFDEEYLDDWENYNGQTFRLLITVQVDEDSDADTIYNTAFVDVNGLTYESERISVEVIFPELEIEKSVGQEVYQIDDTMKWTVKASQTGDAGTHADDVVVSDTLPDALSVDEGSATATLCQADGTTEPLSVTVSDDGGTWTVESIDELLQGEYIVVTFTTTATLESVGADLTNTAVADSSNCDSAEDSAKPEVVQPDLAIEKEAEEEEVEVGDTLHWSVSVTQTVEEAVAKGVVISDTVPDQLSLDEVPTCTVGEETYVVDVDGAAWSVDIPTLSYGETVEIAFTTTVVLASDDPIVNTATTYADYVDEEEDSDEVTATFAALMPLTGSSETAGLTGLGAVLVASGAALALVLRSRRRRV